jgi:hypothetical protein
MLVGCVWPDSLAMHQSIRKWANFTCARPSPLEQDARKYSIDVDCADTNLESVF